ncbi:hypothetical protein MRX96_027200 [Rhipicephalus microplus]
MFTDHIINGTEIQASLFEDKVNMATVSVEKTSDGVKVIKIIFKNLVSPSVEVLLVGVEKSSKNQEYKYTFGSDKLMNDVTSLHMLAKYVEDNLKQYGSPDVVLLLTGRDIYESTLGGINKNVAGIAYEGGVCTERRAALAEDNPGAFSGIIDAAHELGHSLGASHDGTQPNTLIPGHPGSQNCSAKSGRLMTYVDGGHLRYRFSDCNEREIRHVLKERGEQCWKINAPKTYSIRGVFPGAILKAADYCKRLYKSNHVYVSASYILKIQLQN